jgi:hypothetical protein
VLGSPPEITPFRDFSVRRNLDNHNVVRGVDCVTGGVLPPEIAVRRLSYPDRVGGGGTAVPITIQALDSGVLDACIFRSWVTKPGMPWDWLTGELYTLYRFLNDGRVRGLYNATESIRVYAKLANLRGSRVSLEGVKTTLRGSYGRPTNLGLVPLSWHEWQLEAGRDSWPAVREFLHLALADSGAYGYEGRCRPDGWRVLRNAILRAHRTVCKVLAPWPTCAAGNLRMRRQDRGPGDVRASLTR